MIRSQASGVVGAALSGLLWQAGAVAAPLMVKYAIDHGVLTKDRPRAADLARCAAGGRAAGDDRGCRTALLRDPEPVPVGCARPRRDLRARAAPGCELPRSRRAGRADVARVVRLGTRRADDGLDRAHDRLRPDGVRGRDRAARPRLATGVDRVDPAAADLVRGLGVLAALPRAHRAPAGALGRGRDAGRGDGERHPCRERPRSRWPTGRRVPEAQPLDRRPRARHRPAWMRCSCRPSSSCRCSG